MVRCLSEVREKTTVRLGGGKTLDVVSDEFLHQMLLVACHLHPDNHFAPFRHVFNYITLESSQ